jgi:hypothetical protein
MIVSNINEMNKIKFLPEQPRSSGVGDNLVLVSGKVGFDEL